MNIANTTARVVFIRSSGRSSPGRAAASYVAGRRRGAEAGNPWEHGPARSRDRRSCGADYVPGESARAPPEAAPRRPRIRADARDGGRGGGGGGGGSERLPLCRET